MIKLKDYAKIITKLAKQYPNINVFYSLDDDWNDFQAVAYSPSVGEHVPGSDTFDPDGDTINACCINQKEDYNGR